MHAVTLDAPATDLTSLTAREVAALVRVGRVDAQEVVAAHLARLSAGAPILTDRRTGAQAVAGAVRLDTRLRHGLPGGPLAGVPLVLDTFLGVTEVLQSAGAVVLGTASSAADAARAVAGLLVPLAVVAGGGADAATAQGLVGLDLVAGEERLGVLARDPRDLGLVLGAVRAPYDPAGLVLPARLGPADRALAESRLRTSAARVHLS